MKINTRLEYLLIAIISLFHAGCLSARISVECDVVYEKSIGEWSDYYRRDVEFLSGREMGGLLNVNKLYAVIWFSQTNCAIIEMEYRGAILGDIDKDFMYSYFGGDILNEGKAGIQTNGNTDVKWRLYGKDENSFLIDTMFNQYPYDSYNQGVKNNIQSGLRNNRKRPKEELMYAGLDKGVVIWESGDYYLIQTKTNCVVAIRNTIYAFFGTVEQGDIVFGHFGSTGDTDIKNATQNYTGLRAKVMYLSQDYRKCVKWLEQYLDSN